MKPLSQTAGLTERVYAAILDEILDGNLPAGEHLVQEQLATELGVSRQPIQQAMALLKADGLVEEIGTRGLKVGPLDLDRMHDHYDLRAVLDGYAARAAATRVQTSEPIRKAAGARMRAILSAGAAAIAKRSVRDQIRQDEAFHKLIYDLSGNAVLTEAVEPHWRFLRRAMADILRHAAPPADILDQHAAIADAILSGDYDLAETLARTHASMAANLLSQAMRSRAVGNDRAEAAS